jgi:hypothetical protein
MNQGTLAERIQTLTDKTNQYDLINNRLSNLDTDISNEFGGRGITRLGRRAQQLTRARELDAQRQEVLSEVEYLRGNIETAERLAREAEAKRNTPKDEEKFVTNQDLAKSEVARQLKGKISDEAYRSLENMTTAKFVNTYLDPNVNLDELTEVEREAIEIYRVALEAEDANRETNRNVFADRAYRIQSPELITQNTQGGGSSSSSSNSSDEYTFRTQGSVSQSQADDLIALISIMNPELGERVRNFTPERVKETATRLGITTDILLGNKVDGMTVPLSTKPEDYNEYIIEQYRKKK